MGLHGHFKPFGAVGGVRKGFRSHFCLVDASYNLAGFAIAIRKVIKAWLLEDWRHTVYSCLPPLTEVVSSGLID